MNGSIRLSMANDNKTIVTLSGVLDQDLSINLRNIVPKVAPPVVLDLTQVPHLTIAGSGAILSFYQHHLNKPEIQGASAKIISLLELTGASAYVQISPASNESH